MSQFGKFMQVAQRLLNAPLAMDPLRVRLLADGFELLRLQKISAPAALFSDEDATLQSDNGYVVENGVAFIMVSGVLFQRDADCWWGGTGYDVIRAQVSAAVGDSSVQAIVLLIDSPGGEVAGCFALVDDIYEARGTKPIWAILDENAYSAAYAIASAADKICVPQTGGTGSIGVIAAFLDISKLMENNGIAMNIIQFGDRKADGSPYIPLNDAGRARFQSQIDAMGTIFVETVARNRKLQADDIIAQQATTFLGQSGVDAGLADMVASPDEALAALLATLQL